jgi:hypothetical protein
MDLRAKATAHFGGDDMEFVLGHVEYRRHELAVKVGVLGGHVGL